MELVGYRTVAYSAVHDKYWRTVTVQESNALKNNAYCTELLAYSTVDTTVEYVT